MSLNPEYENEIAAKFAAMSTPPPEQKREVALKFARDAVSLIDRGLPADVCARKLLAAAAVLEPRLISDAHTVAESLALLCLELVELRAASKQLELF